RMTRDEANDKAMELAKADPSFDQRSQREWAEAIGCSEGGPSPAPAQASPTKADDLPHLNEKQRKALTYIKKHTRARVTSDQIAGHVDATAETVRRWCAKDGVLYAHGVRNDRDNEGYYVAPM